MQENIIISAVILWVGNTTKEMNALLKENIAAFGPDMPILCFLHLPRTAGSTLNRLLKYTFGDRAIFHADLLAAYGGEAGLSATLAKRSEERRVGKECSEPCRCRGAPGH